MVHLAEEYSEVWSAHVDAQRTQKQTEGEQGKEVEKKGDARTNGEAVMLHSASQASD